MRRFFIIVVGFLVSLYSFSQNYPAEWQIFTSVGYISDVQTDYLNKNQSEVEKKEYLLNIARANVAKQIQLSVADQSSIQKNAINGHSTIYYASNSNFSTDVNVKLLETKSSYNKANNSVAAIAYVNKRSACQYYQKEISIIYSKIENAISVSENYVALGFENKAKKELEGILGEFDKLDEPFFWLCVFECSQQTLDELLEKKNNLYQKIKQKVAECQNSSVVYINCTAELFGDSYSSLVNDIKGQISSIGCSFTNDYQQANWVIRIDASSRENIKTESGSQISYSSFVDANVSIDKVATGQRIYENVISVKGAHTKDYKEAARNAYKNVGKKISDVVKEQIQ